MVKYVLFLAVFISSGYASAGEVRSELAGVFKYLDQETGSNNFYGVSVQRSFASGFYVGVEMMVPSGSENNHFQTSITVKEHGGLYFSYQSPINEHVYYELSLIGGIAMVEKVDSYGDASGICDCPYGFIEPVVSVLYNITPDFSIGGTGGILKISTESIYVSGVKVALKF